MFEYLSVFETNILELALKADRGALRASMFFKASTANSSTRIGAMFASSSTSRSSAQRTAGLTLSHGQKQWLEIGMLLDAGPEAAARSTSRSPA